MVPMLELLKNTLAEAMGVLLSGFTILPDILLCANRRTGEIKKTHKNFNIGKVYKLKWKYNHKSSIHKRCKAAPGKSLLKIFVILSDSERSSTDAKLCTYRMKKMFHYVQHDKFVFG